MKTEPENEMDIINYEEYTEVVRKQRKREYFDKIFEQNTFTQYKPPERDPAIRNRYEILQNNTTTTATIENRDPVNIKPTQPPPIIIHHRIKDYQEFIKYIKNQLEDTIEFHTFTPKHEKTYGYIIRGLDQDPNPEDIKNDLKETQKLKVIEIFKIKKNYRPLFLAITNKDKH